MIQRFLNCFRRLKLFLFKEKEEVKREIDFYHRIQNEYAKRKEEIIEWAISDGRFDQEVNYYRNHPYEMFPYEWCNREELIKQTKLFSDGDFRYVIHNNRRLYLDSRWTYVQLQLEQKDSSPHKYFSKEFYVPENAIFCDIGAAEGIMALECIDICKKSYLIEYDSKWKQRLEKTFEPFSEKAIIVPKYASDIDDEDNVKLDSLLQNEEDVIVLKIDVEGMESVVLSGTMETLNKKRVLVSMAIYHKPEDEEKFTNFFRNLGYEIEISENYAYLAYSEKPFLRRCILRAKNY